MEGHDASLMRMIFIHSDCLCDYNDRSFVNLGQFRIFTILGAHEFTSWVRCSLSLSTRVRMCVCVSE